MTEARDCSSLAVVSERFFCTEETTSDRFFSTESNSLASSSLLFSFSPADSPCMFKVSASRRTTNSSRRERKRPREALSTRAANRPQRLVPKMPFMLPNSTWIVSSVPCVEELSIATPAVATEYMRPKNVPIRPRRITVPPELRGTATVEPLERTSNAIGESSLTPLLNSSRAMFRRLATIPSPSAVNVRRLSQDSTRASSSRMRLRLERSLNWSIMNTANIAAMIIQPKSGAPK